MKKILIVIVILILIGGGFYFYKNTQISSLVIRNSNNNLEQSPQSCADFTALSSYVSANITKPDSQNIIEMNPNVISSFRWRRSVNEPYVTYPIQNGFESNYSTIVSDGKDGWKQTGTNVLQSMQNDFSLISEGLEKKAKELGLSVDQFNTQLKTPYFRAKEDDYVQTFGFKKGVDLYSIVIKYAGGQHQASPDGKIIVTCGKAIADYDAVYDTLSPKADSSVKNAYEDYVQIAAVSPDNKVFALTGSYNQIGTANYYYFNGKTARLISSGSYPAQCDALEANGVGKGMRCFSFAESGGTFEGKAQESDWKTYTDGKYGFSFSYPSDLTSDVKGPNVAQQSYETIYFKDSYNNAKFQIDIFHQTDKDLTVANYTNYFHTSGLCDLRNLDSRPGVKIVQENEIPFIKVEGGKGNLASGCFYSKNKSNNLVVLSILLPNSQQDGYLYTPALMKVEALLSTFKFTNL